MNQILIIRLEILSGGDKGKQTQMAGDIAKSLMDNAAELLAKNPVIEQIELLAIQQTIAGRYISSYFQKAAPNFHILVKNSSYFN